MIRIVILASTRGTHVEAILRAKAEGALSHISVEKVISDVENAGALEKAEKFKVPAIFLDRKNMSSAEYKKKLALEISQPDLILLLGYMRILDKDLIREHAGKIVNVHPSLLPKYGGRGFYGHFVHAAVLANGEKESGMTLHEVDEGVDTGQIIMQKKVKVLDGDTVETLSERVKTAEKTALLEFLEGLR